MRERLCLGEDEASSGVAARGESEAQMVSVLDQRKNGFEKLGCATCFDDDLGRVNKEA